MKVLFTFSILFGLFVGYFMIEPSYGKETQCTFTREYITTLEYLRVHKDYAIPEAEARKLAQKVSEGCTGAAQRFIKVLNALSHVGVSANDSIQTGIEISAQTDTVAETFVSVFLKAYLQEYLDLDIGSSLKMARSLSTEFQGDVLAVRDDFERLVQFCVNAKQLDLPKPECGAFAARIARRGEAFSGGIADPFIRVYLFLRSETGPALVTGQALQLAEQLTSGGRDSAENFIQAFKYGVSPKGLGSSVQEAVQFAKQLALPESPPEK